MSRLIQKVDTIFNISIPKTNRLKVGVADRRIEKMYKPEYNLCLNPDTLGDDWYDIENEITEENFKEFAKDFLMKTYNISVNKIEQYYNRAWGLTVSGTARNLNNPKVETK